MTQIYISIYLFYCVVILLGYTSLRQFRLRSINCFIFSFYTHALIFPVWYLKEIFRYIHIYCIIIISWSFMSNITLVFVKVYSKLHFLYFHNAIVPAYCPSLIKPYFTISTDISFLWISQSILIIFSLSCISLNKVLGEF